jgi:putative ABC transport system ATP-binding protein
MHDMSRLARDDGVAVVVVTHDMDLVGLLADAVYAFDVTPVSDTHILSVCQPVSGDMA